MRRSTVATDVNARERARRPAMIFASPRKVVAAIVGGVIPVLAMSISVACGSANTPPVADAGESLVGIAGYRVELSATGSSDADGDALTYAWDLAGSPKGSEAVLSDPDSANPTLIPDALGEYVVTLAVNDGESWSPPASVTVSASAWFTKVTRQAGVLGGGPRKSSFINGEGPGAAWGDYDNDGDLDLYVTSDGFDKDAPASSMLYRNDGDGAFSELAADAGVAATCNAYGSA
jgi:hypothetical protein